MDINAGDGVGWEQEAAQHLGLAPLALHTASPSDSHTSSAIYVRAKLKIDNDVCVVGCSVKRNQEHCEQLDVRHLMA